MAIDIKPSTWLASYSYSSSTLHIPLASLSGLVAGDCDPTTGNFEKIMLALLTTAQTKYDSFSTADKPKKMLVSTRTNVVNNVVDVTFVGSVGTFNLGSE